MSYDPPRIASAPYNFVPIYDQVVWSPPCLPRQDRYDPERHSGYLDVTLTTLAPLFIRGPLSADDYVLLKSVEGDPSNPLNRKLQTRPEFYHHGDPMRPVIPSASLVGMLRNVVAAASCGRLQDVSDASIYFRTFATDSAKRAAYVRTVTRKEVRAGWLRRKGSRWEIVPCTVPEEVRGAEGAAAVSEEVVENGYLHLKGSSGLVSLPASASWDAEKQEWRMDGFDSVTLDAGSNLRAIKVEDIDIQQGIISLKEPERLVVYHRDDAPPNAQPVSLVQSGPMQGKEKIAIVFEPPADSKGVLIAKDAVGHLLKGATRYQRDTNLKDDDLVDSSPVFYIAPNRPEGEIIHFGFSPFFRIAYVEDEPSDLAYITPKSLLREAHREVTRLDLAEALFGFAPDREGEQGKTLRMRGSQDRKPVRSYRKRVSVEDAFLVLGPGGNPPDDLFLCDDDDPLVPRILASPKPSAYSLYLDQPREAFQTHVNEKGQDRSAEKVRHYGTAEARVRGFKRYWHQGPETGVIAGDGWRSHIETSDAEAREKMLALHRCSRSIISEMSREEIDTQHTLMRPLRPGIQFKFRIYFENLSHVELGALLWALEPRQADDPEPLVLAHHLGMGKSLGMGSIGLSSKLTATDRDLERYDGRYSKLFDVNDDGTLQWNLANVRMDSVELTDVEGLVQVVGQDQNGRDPVEAFQHHVLYVLRRNLARCPDPLTAVENLASTAKSFGDLPHIQALFRMMAWPGIRSTPPDEPAHDIRDSYGRVQHRGDTRWANTRYMQIELEREDETINEYQGDPVLPPVMHELFAEVERRSRNA